MEILSALNSGLQGLQTAQNRVTQAAEDIAQQTAAPRPDEPQAEPPAEQVSQRQTPSVTESLVSLRVAEREAEASANVVRAADETLGTLIDTRV